MAPTYGVVAAPCVVANVDSVSEEAQSWDGLVCGNRISTAASVVQQGIDIADSGVEPRSVESLRTSFLVFAEGTWSISVKSSVDSGRHGVCSYSAVL